MFHLRRAKRAEMAPVCGLLSSACVLYRTSSSILLDPVTTLGLSVRRQDTGENVVNFMRAIHMSSVLWD